MGLRGITEEWEEGIQITKLDKRLGFCESERTKSGSESSRQDNGLHIRGNSGGFSSRHDERKENENENEMKKNHFMWNKIPCKVVKLEWFFVWKEEKPRFFELNDKTEEFLEKRGFMEWIIWRREGIEEKGLVEEEKEVGEKSTLHRFVWDTCRWNCVFRRKEERV